MTAAEIFTKPTHHVRLPLTTPPTFLRVTRSENLWRRQVKICLAAESHDFLCSDGAPCLCSRYQYTRLPSQSWRMNANSIPEYETPQHQPEVVQVQTSGSTEQKHQSWRHLMYCYGGRYKYMVDIPSITSLANALDREPRVPNRLSSFGNISLVE
jgi:hypothetical protein